MDGSPDPFTWQSFHSVIIFAGFMETCGRAHGPVGRPTNNVSLCVAQEASTDEQAPVVAWSPDQVTRPTEGLPFQLQSITVVS